MTEVNKCIHNKSFQGTSQSGVGGQIITLTYLNYPNWPQKGESLVETSDHQKDLYSLQDGQRQAFVHLLEFWWVSWVHRLRAEVKDTLEELGGLGMDSQLGFPFEVNDCGII